MGLPKLRADLSNDVRTTDRILTTTVQFIRGLTLDQYLELVEFVEQSKATPGTKEAKLKALDLIRSIPVGEESVPDLELLDKAG